MPFHKILISDSETYSMNTVYFTSKSKTTTAIRVLYPEEIIMTKNSVGKVPSTSMVNSRCFF